VDFAEDKSIERIFGQRKKYFLITRLTHANEKRIMRLLTGLGLDRDKKLRAKGDYAEIGHMGRFCALLGPKGHRTRVSEMHKA